MRKINTLKRYCKLLGDVEVRDGIEGVRITMNCMGNHRRIERSDNYGQCKEIAFTGSRKRWKECKLV
jgi:hypothetical protein